MTIAIPVISVIISQSGRFLRDEAGEGRSTIRKMHDKKEEERVWIEVNHAIFRRKSGKGLCPEDGPR